MMANKEDTAIGSTAHQPEITPTLEASLSSNSTPNSTDKGHSDDAIRPNDGSAGPATVAAGQRAAQLGLSRAQLEQEVGQVMGNLNSWWGGVKKQAASALSSIKADLDKTVSQAQADLEYLRSAKVEIARKPEEEPKIPSATKGQETGEAEPPIADPATEGPSTELTHGSGLLDRLTTSTNQLQQTLQSTFQSTLASAAANPALSNPKQLRLQLAENLRLSSAKANLQLSVKQAEKMAEEYLRKGDQWVKDAEKWMGDAVKVLPPEDSTTRYVATSWDGGDFYAFTTSVAPADQVIFEADPRTPRPSSSAVLGASRKDILLSQLRQNKDLLMLNPESDSETVERRTEYRTWLENMWDAEKEAGKAREIGNVGDIRMALGKKQSLEVPELLTDEQFWQRYLFHIHMIEAEDEKRKKVLEATAQEVQDDFSWDDEPEDSPATHQTREVQPAPGPAVEAKKNTDTVVKRPTNPTNVSTATSPRDSEESYDVVSDQGVKELARKEEKTKPASTEDEDEDSDWE